jgi:hypothetical protein
MKEYEIWSEGYAATGESAPAHRLLRPGESNSRWSGVTFQQAVVKALNELHWTMLSEMLQGCGSCLYDAKNNTYWGCRFFDNESDARKSFG